MQAPSPDVPARLPNDSGHSKKNGAIFFFFSFLSALVLMIIEQRHRQNRDGTSLATVARLCWVWTLNTFMEAGAWLKLWTFTAAMQAHPYKRVTSQILFLMHFITSTCIVGLGWNAGMHTIVRSDACWPRMCNLEIGKPTSKLDNHWSVVRCFCSENKYFKNDVQEISKHIERN